MKKITISGNDFGTNGGNLIGYGKVEEIELSNTNENFGEKVYSYLNTENKTKLGCPYSPDFRNGLISLEEIYDNSGNKISDKSFFYDDYHPLTQGLKCVNIVQLSTGSKVPCSNIYAPPLSWMIKEYDEPTDVYNGSQFGYDSYTINCRWYKLTNTVTEHFLAGNIFKTTENYAYNAEGKINSLTVTNSKDENLITKYYYPIDRMISPDVDNYMINMHNTGTPVIIEKCDGTNLLTRKRIVYGPDANCLSYVPKYIFVKNGSMPEEKRVTINSYDSKSNITQFSDESNINNSYVYGNNFLNLISATKNATTNETGYTGFENNETNSFDLPTYTNFEFVDKDNAFTGSSALKVPTGYGPGASFNVGKYANDHCGYKASVWVKGSNRAYLHIEVSGNWETHQRAYNIDKTEGWHLLTVELAKPKIPNPEDHELGIKVYIGTDGGEATFDDLRFQPMDAEMTSYTYEPLVGVTSASDANNKPTIYQYDDFGRLILTRDYLGNILKKYDYHYKE